MISAEQAGLAVWPATTLSEFLDLLPIARGRGWRIDDNGWLRDRKGYCPICAVVAEIDPTSRYATMTRLATNRIGMVMFERERQRIEIAADTTDSRTRRLRAKMRAILGVTK